MYVVTTTAIKSEMKVFTLGGRIYKKLHRNGVENIPCD